MINLNARGFSNPSDIHLDIASLDVVVDCSYYVFGPSSYGSGDGILFDLSNGYRIAVDDFDNRVDIFDKYLDPVDDIKRNGRSVVNFINDIGKMEVI